MMPLPVIAFCAMACLVGMLIEVWCLWGRNDKLTDAHEDMKTDMADMWRVIGQLLDTVEGILDIAEAKPETPATEPDMPVVSPDTQPSQAVVVGGARVTGKTAPTKAADWVETALEQYRKTGSWK